MGACAVDRQLDRTPQLSYRFTSATFGGGRAAVRERIAGWWHGAADANRRQKVP
jgi:hypothetical protein